MRTAESSEARDMAFHPDENEISGWLQIPDEISAIVHCSGWMKDHPSGRRR
jgi:hypothetical protein